MKKISAVLFALPFVAMAHLAHAETGIDEGEAYGVPSLRDLVQTSVMMGIFDTTDPRIIDEYARAFYCDLYTQKFSNDFEWNNIRQEISARVEGKRDYYRILYEFKAPVYLGRYNFDTQDFPFEKGSALIGIGAMELMPSPGKMAGTDAATLARYKLSDCISSATKGKNVSIFPKQYMVKLTEALTLDRLKVPVRTSEEILNNIQAMNNSEDRLVYLRFRVKLQTVSKFRDIRKAQNATVYFVGNLTSVDVFLDENLTQFITSVPLNKE